MNKLSELSKPVAWAFKDANDVEHASITKKANLYGRHDFQPLYSQEYVSALLADNEAKDKCIAELQRITEGVDQLAIDGGWTARGMSEYAKSLEERLEKWQELASNQVIKINELQAKLATPVRLQSPWADHLGNRWMLEGPVVDAIRAAGFKCVGD